MKKPNRFRTYQQIVFDGSFDRYTIKKIKDHEYNIIEMGHIYHHFNDNTKTMRPLIRVDYLSYLGFKQEFPRWVKQIGHLMYYFTINHEIMFYPFPAAAQEIYLIIEYIKK